MVRTYRGDRKTVTVSNGGVAVSPTGTSFGVAASASTDFPGPGTATFEVQGTGESIIVGAGLGTTSWSSITRGADHTTAAVIPDGAILLEIEGATDLANFIQRDETALPTSLLSTATPLIDGTATVGTSTKAARGDHVHPANVSSIKKTGSSALTGDVTLTGGTNVTLTQSGQDISIAASGGGSVSDATTSAVGVVEVDHAPSGPHPVALTTDGLTMPSGLLGTSGTKAAAGDDSRLSDTRTPTAGSVVNASVSASAAIAESKLSLASDAAAGTASRRTLGTGATQATAGNDARLSDARTPTAHETTHISGGSDALPWGTIHGRGTHAGRPAAGNTGYIYYETDTTSLFRDNGSTWDAYSGAGGGGSSTLAGDSDVSLSSPATGDLLQYNGSAWVNIAKPASASYLRSSGDYTTTSTSFVDVDGTNMSFTITTGAHRVMIGFVGMVINSVAGGITALDVTVDGTRQGGTFGLVWNRDSGPNYEDTSFVYLTDALSAGSHTFKLQWRVGSASTSTLAGTGNTFSKFYVMEQLS